MSEYTSKLLLAEQEFNTNHQLSISLALEVHQSEPQNLKALEILCLSAIRKGDSNSFSKFLKKAITIANLNSSNVLYDFGATLMGSGRAAESILFFKNALEKSPDSFHILHDLGVALASTGNAEDGLIYLEKAMEIDGTSHELFYNIGRIYDSNNEFQKSLEFYEKALLIKCDFIPALINKGVALYELKNFSAAIASYEQALKYAPHLWEIWLNIGNLFQQIEQPTNAIKSYDRALELSPNNPEAVASKSDIYQSQHQYRNAIICLESALNIDPTFPYSSGALLHAKMCICDWKDFESHKSKLLTAVANKEKASPPFPLLAITDNEEIHLKAAQTWALDKLLPESAPLKPYQKKNKIRLGYFSADFHQHATALLMLDLFKHHNPEIFQVYAFSYGPNTQDKMQRDIASSAYKFIDVKNMSDEGIVNLSHDLEIDIAIDLKGYTEKSRSNIFSRRLAPLQISYLGYPGTLGAKCFDYIIADLKVIPRENQQFYSEKVIYLPNCYQINSQTRKFSEKTFSRADFGLPQDGFVFCCFNHNYKITPELFKTWVEILSTAKNSILWLLEDNESASQNLKVEMSKLGLNKEKLIFTKRLPIEEHLSRHQLADLFLDTNPCNAHTTASDALWAGLPVLTLAGQSFASNVSSSLLHTLDLAELVCPDVESYKQKAIQLSLNPEKLKEIRFKLKQNSTSSPLFNSEKFTRKLESALVVAHQNIQSGSAPHHIYPKD